MVLAALGGAYIVRQAARNVITPSDYMTGWGLSLVACLFGAFTSFRQTLLHIKPDDPGYGGTVLNMHLYVWALILFVAATLVVSVTLSSGGQTASTRPLSAWQKSIGYGAIAFLVLVIVINLVSVFMLEGFHWILPDDPDRYQLLYDLGLKE